MRTAKCKTCGETITFNEVRRKWHTGSKWQNWKCNPTRDYPVRSHSPIDEQLPLPNPSSPAEADEQFHFVTDPDVLERAAAVMAKVATPSTPGIR